LWTILLRGESGRAYNVGSEEALTIAELAGAATRACDGGACEILVSDHPRPGAIARRYVPATTRARLELGLEHGTSLSEAIRRTATWERTLGRASVDNAEHVQ
jgi:dTDP-glucose 4,6-dehydratase